METRLVAGSIAIGLLMCYGILSELSRTDSAAQAATAHTMEGLWQSRFETMEQEMSDVSKRVTRIEALRAAKQRVEEGISATVPPSDQGETHSTGTAEEHGGGLASLLENEAVNVTSAGDPSPLDAAFDQTWPRCQGNPEHCAGPLGGAKGCVGPELLEREMYGKLVPQALRVQYVHLGDPQDLAPYQGAFRDAEATCTGLGKAVCSQDQLGGAWMLGYENGCRGWVRDRFAGGVTNPEAMNADRGRINARITVSPVGSVLYRPPRPSLALAPRLSPAPQHTGTASRWA
jgi:hypothetical protein